MRPSEKNLKFWGNWSEDLFRETKYRLGPEGGGGKGGGRHRPGVSGLSVTKHLLPHLSVPTEAKETTRWWQTQNMRRDETVGCKGVPNTQMSYILQTNTQSELVPVSDNRPEPPPMSSTTPPLAPLSRSQSVLRLPEQVLTASSPKPEIFGNLQGTRCIFLFFAPIHRELKSLHIRRPISMKFTKVQDMGFGFGALVNRRRSRSRKYRSFSPLDENP